MAISEKSGQKRGPKRVWPKGTIWASVPLPLSVMAAIREKYQDELKPGRAVMRALMDACPGLPWPGKDGGPPHTAPGGESLADD